MARIYQGEKEGSRSFWQGGSPIDIVVRIHYYGEMIRKVRRIALFCTAVGFIALIAAGCATTPARPAAGYTPAAGAEAAKTAAAMIGRPYKYRGDSPAGFDCSGLVRYSYLSAGIDVPHGTKALLNVTKTVGIGSARQGDLLFFNEKGGGYSHVGIYLGNYSFVHAPASGRTVRRDSLKNRYWKNSFIEARRFR